MAEPRLVHHALADLDRAARAFRAEEGLESTSYAFESSPEVNRPLLELDVESYVEEFGRVTSAYGSGAAGDDLPADVALARSLIPPGTGALRDFSYVGAEIPEFLHDNCVGCMECVTQCPDTAILAKVLPADTVADDLEGDDAADELKTRWSVTRKYHAGKAGEPQGLFGIFVDPTKCKGCAECVDVCGDHDALRMVTKTEATLGAARRAMEHFHRIPDTDTRFLRERIAVDRMLACERTHLYVGGAGSCAGCGEASVLRMLMAQVGWERGAENVGLVAATGCNTVYSSTYPYNPFLVPWTNSLFENAAAVAMGVRKRWDQKGWTDKVLWAIGGDGALFDIGFGSLSRLLASGLDVNVLVLDTQVYSNTGGQTSTASFTGQSAKMSPHGKARKGKIETRKDLARIAMMHPGCYVAQTTAANAGHFYRVVSEAMAHPGPSVVIAYSTCQPEHGVGDADSARQASLAVESRAFPLLSFDPGRGDTIAEQLDLRGNPSARKDWHLDKEGNPVDFVAFARTEGRFRRHIGRDGEPSPELLAAQDQILRNWHALQELAGLR